MDNKMISWVLEGLKKEVSSLQNEVAELKELIDKTRAKGSLDVETIPVERKNELLNTKEVLQKLGISYNTLQNIVRTGAIKPLRISPRRVRFTLASINKYITGLSN